MPDSHEVPPLSYDADAQGHRIDFPTARPRVLTIVFALLWLGGWLLFLGLTLTSLRFGRLNFLAIVVLVAAGPAAGLALFWVLSGKRESLIVTPSELRIERWAGPIRLRRSISVSTVTALRSAVAPSGLLSDYWAVRHFYSGGRGSIVIETDTRQFSVGHTVPASVAEQVINDIQRFMPQVNTQSAAAIPRRDTIGTLAVVMTAISIGFALNGPVRLAIVDRSICFYDDRIVPRHPIDVSAIHPAGRVLLVPIEDFPVQRAAAIAEHFRTRFGVAIDVAPAMDWPEGAYVEDRGQMNSEMMLTRLESTYPAAAERIVVIGLTRRDIFDPEVNWAYVFSYRRSNRLAIVSPAHMDRGCMGVVQADDARIMARLRKMVGKNIGLMYFGLDISDDPASMLYGNIGGPQELDAMSEWF